MGTKGTQGKGEVTQDPIAQIVHKVLQANARTLKVAPQKPNSSTIMTKG